MPAVIDKPATSTPTIDQPRAGGSAGYGARLIVLNDDTLDVRIVIVAFCKVLPGMNPESAVELALKIHNTGQAVAFEGVREVCELYSEMLTGYGLTCRVQ